MWSHNTFCKKVLVWNQKDPAAESFYGLSSYVAMGNNPVVMVDPDGDFPVAILTSIAIGAAIGAGTSAAVYTVNASITGNWNWQQFGMSVAMGAVGGAIGGGISGAFAGTAFGNSLGFGILNNIASHTATSAAFGHEITLGSMVGGAIGGAISGFVPGFKGVRGGSLKNALAEIGYRAGKGAVSGAISGGISASINNKDAGRGVLIGAQYGALAGATLAGLNIMIMGTTYVPDNPSTYGDFGAYGPVYRRGHFLWPVRNGIALGRNLVTKQIASEDYNYYLRAHETGHFVQQREMGFGRFYSRTLKEYLIDPGIKKVYGTPGTLEYLANRYSLKQIGYYYYHGNR